MPDREKRTDRGFSPPLLAFGAIALSLALAYGAYRLAGYSWDQVVSYESPYTAMTGADFSGRRPALTDPVPDAVARRVVVVLIDGLREDASRRMNAVEALRERGADVALTVPQPSLSYPTWTTIMTGATPQISGVTTNWFTGPVKVETLLDVAAGSGRSVLVAGTTDLDTMFRASQVASATALVEWSDTEYLTDDIVDGALEADARLGGADFIFVLMPDVDEAGHTYGGASEQYAATVARVDSDLARLIAGLDDGATTFFVLPDHGHIDSGGHGGWEPDVIRTWAAMAGPGIKRTTASAQLADIAPTVAVVAGLQAPLQGIGTAVDAVLADTNGRARDAEFVRSAGITLEYVTRVLGDASTIATGTIPSPAALADLRSDANAERLSRERTDRLPLAIGLLIGILLVAAAIGRVSGRLLASGLAGAIASAAVYNALFFGVHRLQWSLSAFNDEDMIQAFFTQRMAEAAISGVVGALAAALMYAALNRRAGLQGVRASEWLALGASTVLLAQMLLAAQVALFVWRWGVQITWLLPDFREAFKYDLDLTQMTGLGAAALLGPPAAWLLGRLASRNRRVSA